MSSSTLSYVVWTLILAYALVLWGLSYLRPRTVAHPSQVVGKLATHPVGAGGARSRLHVAGLAPLRPLSSVSRHVRVRATPRR